MKTTHPFVAAIFFGLLLGPRLWSQQPTKVQTMTAEEKIRDIQKCLSATIETAKLQEKMPLEQFLQALAAQVPADKKLLLRIEKEAFGKEYADLAKSEIQFGPFPKRMRLGTALRLMLGRLEPPMGAYRIEPEGIVITTLERSSFTATYDVHDLLDRWEARRDGFGYIVPERTHG
jgi:hypothetical protein